MAKSPSAAFRQWLGYAMNEMFVGEYEFDAAVRTSEHVRRQKLIYDVLFVLEHVHAPIAPLFRSVTENLGLDETVVEEERACDVTGTIARHHRRLRTYEPVKSGQSSSVEMVLRYDLVPFVKAYYTYVHFETYVTMCAYAPEGNAHDVMSDEWCSELWEIYAHCERQCRALMSPAGSRKRRRVEH